MLPSAMPEMAAIDLRVAIHAAWNTRELSGVDPARVAAVREARAPLMELYMRRSAAKELRWCVTAYPCEAFAQDADMSLAAYEDFVYRAGWLHLPDPVAAWRGFAEKLRAIADRLSGVRTLRVLAEDTDLSVGVAGRTWVPCNGERNFPDGEVFTGPIETETTGDVRFSFPAIFSGREVEDVRLRFDGGRVVRSEAAAGQELLRQMLTIDEGASILGEFAIGTNYGVQGFSKQILFDEKIGGTCHMAVGAGYPETGSTNHSGLHWDMVCDLRSGGEIHADGELIYRNGRFLPAFAPDLSPPQG
jgi:aminopeptidase